MSAARAKITLTSPAFKDGEALPTRLTCEGDGVSPELAWSDPPGETKSLALIVDDPDAPDPARPQRTFVHWVVYDIPATARSLPQGAHLDSAAVGTRIGHNDVNKPGWYPPCPPIGRHRYFFKIYALDIQLGALATASKAGLEEAMEGHVLAEGVLVGTYEKRAE
jgi:Raf kinase inhibitor-like YbhB/YbcL family protein